MLFVITGDGKGKTTSALGMVARAKGQGMRCSVLQFIKDNAEAFGECRTFRSMGVLWESYGEGFLWDQETLEPTRVKCLEGWERFKNLALGGGYGLIVLDEFTYVLSRGLLDQGEVLSFLSSHLHDGLFPHVVVTGREAPKALIDMADTASEIREIKHHYHSNGGKAIRGIEF